MDDDTAGLTKLGSQRTEYTYDAPVHDMLETFPAPDSGEDAEFSIEMEFPEFTSLCPKTGQPDFATIVIRYMPQDLCIETKSLKLYFFAFRNHGSFMETIVKKILDDIVIACAPIRCEVIGEYNPRGGIRLTPTAIYE